MGAKFGRRGPATSQGLPSTGWSTFGPENMLIQGDFARGRVTGHPLAQKNSESRPDNRAISLNTGVGIIRESFLEEVTFEPRMED